MEIDDRLYDQIYTDQVAQFINFGMFVDDAKARAREIMADTFVCRSFVECAEYEKDRWQYLDEMSLGGRPYRES